jgi:hypothetical protein
MKKLLPYIITITLISCNSGLIDPDTNERQKEFEKADILREINSRSEGFRFSEPTSWFDNRDLSGTHLIVNGQLYIENQIVCFVHWGAYGFADFGNYSVTFSINFSQLLEIPTGSRKSLALLDLNNLSPFRHISLIKWSARLPYSENAIFFIPMAGNLLIDRQTDRLFTVRILNGRFISDAKPFLNNETVIISSLIELDINQCNFFLR